MSETTASLRRKIGSAGDFQSVVRTMKALAASNIGFQKRAAAVMAESPARANERFVGAVVFGSDQGPVGRVNNVVADHALAGPASICTLNQK